MTTIAQNIVATLAANGVRRVYGLPGDSLNGFTDALRETPSIEWVHVRHEEAGAFAAAAEAALTGEIAVCAGSAGPGNLHLINGLYDANRSRVPVLAIAAHIPSTEIGSNYFQETHPQEVFRECSVYAEQVTDAAQMPRILEIAMRTAVEKRGVAVVVLSGDVGLTAMNSDRVTVVRRTRPRVVPSHAELREAADILNAAGKVTILAGAGVEGAHDEVVALADALAAPIVHAMRGKEFIEYDNPFDVGMTGLLGFSSGYRAMEDCDALLMLGTDFPYQQFYPSKAKIIQVDIRGEQLGRRVPLDLGLVGDVRETAAALLPLVPRKKRRTHLESSLKHYAKARSKLDDLANPTKKGQPLHPQFITRTLDRLAAEDAVFTADVGTPVIWAARYLTMNGRRRLVGSFTHGSMANALPHAMGAQAAFPGRQVVALAGDGGLSMLLGELLTIVQNRLPVKLVVFSNASLNFIELEMKSVGFVNFGTGLDNPNFAAVAEAMGIKGVRVNDSSELETGLKEALAHDGPALVDVATMREELAMPPTITAQQAGGFTLYALRTVLSGRGDEVLDLARANWRRVF
ncbi:pyruvate dehydrogenase [Sinomonas cellulolyticus]|uniref:Pyruvate dehydrogenase [ubiquinone] n=1 Tax=Sinomonas cellulolyticus TaxID=2801916 RepID=A0ABS1K3G7_9MICC|nr:MULTISPECIES: ubiquinone-dependent pyruvate dehydrogenase [Sinomonas]MBL0705847.1 ubiquinone-dependent pyruvate dehydrogenase [Sinomonas cellulolyticus]GHG42304.1 pyruvate dehydrogenase [Sinomonas sp. KCTC 49339]